MPKVTYINHDGSERVLDLKVGQTVMEGGVHNGIDGILGECGGSCMCATCHVYVEPTQWLPVPSEAEDEMLGETVSERRPNSRLGCQIRVVGNLDGLVVHVPENLY